MDQLDADKNGKLDTEELKNCPGLQRSRKEIDSDNDGAISSSELQKRMQDYIREQIALNNTPIIVSYGGRPLAGAKIELIPEEFLVDVIEPATGTTSARGSSRPSIELDPEIRQRGTSGYRSGVYRVKLWKKDSGGKELLPRKLNEESNIGIEVLMKEHMEPIYLRL